MPGPAPAGPVPPGGPSGRDTGPASVPGTSRFRSAWKTGPDGRTVFRLVPPLVLWWVWVAFAAANLADMAIESHDRFALQIGVGLLLATGVMFACAFHPRVITDARGVTVRNPFRDHFVPWGVVTGVFVGDSVEIGARRPPPKKEKTIYSWALYSPRRSRARAEMRTSFFRSGPKRQGFGVLGSVYRYDVDSSKVGRAPAEAKELATQHPSHIMARELARRCEEARRTGDGADGGLRSRWDWLTLAAVLIPAAGLTATILVH